MEVKIGEDFDIIYISFDEPRCEENWADLLLKFPWAKRVHNVKGFDAAHKAAANLSDTERFITVDGDNKVLNSFIDFKFTTSADHENYVYSFAAINHINGLVYGNNGIKIWPKSVVLNMQSHETAKQDGSFALDFCWNIPYVQKREVSSTGYANGSPYQAFRAGFREGVKMSLGHTGWKIDDPSKIITTIYPINLKRLMIWCSVGTDVENGIWSIYGARLGFLMANFSEFNIANINNYDWFNQFWTDNIMGKHVGSQHVCFHSKYQWDSTSVWIEIERLGDEIKEKAGLSLSTFMADQSAFVKQLFARECGEL